MARPRTPTNLLALRGAFTHNPGRLRDRANELQLPLADSIPAAPDWLPNAHAVNEWARLTPILYANRLLTEAGLSALGVLCALHGNIVQMYAAGESPTGNLLAQWRAMTNDFGLTPVAQGKVRPASEKKEANKFASNRLSSLAPSAPLNDRV